MVFWATNFTVTAKVLETWNPVLLAPVRSFVAAVALALLAMAMGQGKYLLKIPTSIVLGAGALVLGGSTVLFIIAQSLIDPVSAAIIVSSMPLLSALFGWYAGREFFTVRLSFGLVLAILGGVIAGVFSSDGQVEISFLSLLGGVLLLIAVVSYIYFARTLVIKLAHIPETPKVAVCFLATTSFTSVVALIGAASGLVPPVVDFSTPTLLNILWAGAISIGLSSALWLTAGKRLGVTVASMHHNMVPFYVMLIAIFSGGVLNPYVLVGAVLVLAGTVLAQFPAKTSRYPSSRRKTLPRFRSRAQ